MEKKLDSKEAVEALLKSHEFSPLKHLGQNFLIDGRVKERIRDLILNLWGLSAAKSDDSQNWIWEIGPGPGTLTEYLLESGLKIRGFEMDQGFCRFLENKFDEKNFTVIPGDFLKNVDFWWEKEKATLVVGNLPYNVASQMIAAFIEKYLLPDVMVFMVQKEVAQRMVAHEGSRDYSAFSILVQLHYEVKLEFNVGSHSFFPAPRVASSIVSMRKRSDFPDRQQSEWILKLNRAMFLHRRKTLSNCWFKKPPFPEASREVLKICCVECGIDPSARGETLGRDKLIELTKLIRTKSDNS